MFSYYCTKCHKWKKPHEVRRERLVSYGNEWSFCPECWEQFGKNHVDPMLTCEWYVAGKVHFYEHAKKKCPELDNLGWMCEDCPLRWKCWTE